MCQTSRVYIQSVSPQPPLRHNDKQEFAMADDLTAGAGKNRMLTNRSLMDFILLRAD